MASFSFDTVSTAVLAKLHPKVSQCAVVAGEQLAAVNIFFRVYSGLRTAEEQNKEYALGRDSNGHIINIKDVRTFAIAGASPHNYGLAFDCVPFFAGSEGKLNWNAGSDEFHKMRVALMSAGLHWSGLWQHNPEKDLDHFYLGPDTPSPFMMSEYAKGVALADIWKSLAI